MTFKEFEQKFRPSDEVIDQLTLKNFIEVNFSEENSEPLYRALVNNHVRSISDLCDLEVNQLREFKRVGPKKVRQILKLQTIVNREVKNVFRADI